MPHDRCARTGLAHCATSARPLACRSCLNSGANGARTTLRTPTTRSSPTRSIANTSQRRTTARDQLTCMASNVRQAAHANSGCNALASAPAADLQIVAPITSTISAVSFQGLSITTPDGEPATLAVIDMQGHIIESGPNVMRAVWEVAIRSYRNFLIGSGHLRVLSKPVSA